MKTRAAIALLAATLLPAAARGDSPPAPAFQGLRANETYDYLRTTDPLLGWQRWKMIPLSADRQTYASVGADLRLRAESTRHPSFTDAPTEEVILQRWMAHAALRHRDHLTVFAQLKGSTIEGDRLRPNPNDRNSLDLHQAFVELGAAADPLQLRAGRQELAYGSSRLVGVRNGPNVRLSFDALRLRTRALDRTLDVFLAQPVSVTADEFDDRGIEGEALWGVYGRIDSGSEKDPRLEAYYLGFRDADARYRATTDEELRHSFGLRWAGRRGAWDWDWEPTLQTGRFGDRDIFGWSLGTDTGRTFAAAPLRPRLGLKANFISGDSGDGAIGTFNALYPRGAYFGEAGIIGPANLVNFEPSLTVRPSPAWQVTASASAFYRASLDDGVYTPGRRLLRAPGGSSERSIGRQYSLETTWRPDTRWRLTAYVSYFDTGAFLRETGSSRPSTFFMLSAELSL